MGNNTYGVQGSQQFWPREPARWHLVMNYFVSPFASHAERAIFLRAGRAFRTSPSFRVRSTPRGLIYFLPTEPPSGTCRFWRVLLVPSRNSGAGQEEPPPEGFGTPVIPHTTWLMPTVLIHQALTVTKQNIIKLSWTDDLRHFLTPEYFKEKQKGQPLLQFSWLKLYIFCPAPEASISVAATRLLLDCY